MKENRTPNQVMDEIAREGLGRNIDLSSGLKAKMRKEDEKQMNKRIFLSGAAALMLVIVILLCIPGVAQAVKRLFGYAPGSGMVEKTSIIRVLKEPVEFKPGETTIIVSQAISDSNHTRLAYQIDNIPGINLPDPKQEDVCHALPTLVLPDGTVLQPKTISGNSWTSGLSRLLEFDALPTDENSIKMVFSCVEAAPVMDLFSNIEILLDFIPAPVDMTVYDVVELPTPTIEASQAEPSSPITMVLNKYIQTDENMILFGALQTNSSDFVLSYIDSSAVHLIDKAGNEIPIEEDYSLSDPEPINSALQNLSLTYRTAGRYLPGEASLVIDQIWVQQKADASFNFDIGSDPQPGQTWQINQTLSVNRREFLIQKVVLDQTGTGISIYYEAPEGTANLMLIDLEHEVLGGGGGDNNTGFTYQDAFPSGIITITLTGYDALMSGPWQTKVTLPPFSDGLAPTPMPEACLTETTWLAALNTNNGEIPQGLPDSLIMTYPTAPDYLYHIFDARLDGSEPIDLGQGNRGSLSLDGKTLVYASEDGLKFRDMETGELTLIPNTSNLDNKPLWSPDGTKIAYTHGSAGVIGPHVIRLMSFDGSNQTELYSDTEANYAQAWLPDSKNLLYTVRNADGSSLNQINVENGQFSNLTSINYQNAGVVVSPDGEQIAYEAMMPGEQYRIYIINLDGSNARLIANADPLVVTNPIWSPDGNWLAMTVHDISLEDAPPKVALVNPETCQIISLTSLHGYVTSWR